MTNFLVFVKYLAYIAYPDCIFLKIVVTSHCDNNMLDNSIGRHIIYI